MTKKDFADLAGVSKPVISNALRNGYLVADAQGMIDPRDPNNVEFVAARLDRRRSDAAPPPPVPKPVKTAAPPPPVSAAPDPPKPPTEYEYLESIDCMDVDALRRIPRHQQTALKDIQNIRDREQKIRSARGELINRELVKRVFAKIYSVDVNELRTLGAALAPEVAAKLGVSDDSKILEVEKMIEDEVFRRLQSIQRVITQFLEDNPDVE